MDLQHKQFALQLKATDDATRTIEGYAATYNNVDSVGDMILPGAFADPLYAKEEIRADMASLYLCAETGIPFRPEQQAAYISN